MALNLDGLSPKALEALINEAQARMQSARSEHVQSVRAKIDALLTAEGLQLSDIYPARGSEVKRGKRAGAGIAKYRNPADAAQTWTGHGKKPGWFVAALKKSGVTAESLLIEPAVAKSTPAKAEPKAIKVPKAAKKVATKAVKKTAARKAAK